MEISRRKIAIGLLFVALATVSCETETEKGANEHAQPGDSNHGDTQAGIHANPAHANETHGNDSSHDKGKKCFLIF